MLNMTKFYKITACISLLFLTAYNLYPISINAQIIENDLCLYGCPTGTNEDNFLVDHQILILSSNRQTKFSDWISYKVIRENLIGDSTSRYWKQDPNIPNEYTFIPDDYQGAYSACDYDRGHQGATRSCIFNCLA